MTITSNHILSAFLLVVFVMMTGCTHFTPTTNSATFHQASGGLAEDLVTVMNELVAIQPDATAVPRVHIESAVVATKSAQAHLGALNKAYGDLNADYVKVKAHDDKWSASWWSERQVHGFWWTVLIVVLCVLGYGVIVTLLKIGSPLSAATGIVGVFGTVVKWMYHTATVGLGALGTKGKAAVTQKVAETKFAEAILTPNPAVPVPPVPEPVPVPSRGIITELRSATASQDAPIG